MNMGHWWDDNDNDEIKHLGIKVSQCHFVCHKSHMGQLYLGLKPGLQYESRNKGHDDNNNKYV